VGQVSGFDLSPFSSLACPRLPIWQDSPPWTRLSPDFDVLHLDLTRRANPPFETRITVPISTTGTAYGVVQWMRIDLDEATTYSTGPEGTHRQGNWLQILHTFARPISVSAGQTAELIVGHDRTNLLVTPA
jgi:type II protein arginine methyltransferase